MKRNANRLGIATRLLTATPGTTRPTGETAKSVAVDVLDDAHDEGMETMTLALSDPSGARLAGATATGTIENSDPMPKAWMVRFGRTVGDQLVEAVTQRLGSRQSPHVTIAGVRVTGRPAALDEAEPESTFEMPEWATGSRLEEEGFTITGDDLRLRSSFHMRAGEEGAAPGEPIWTAWGRVAGGRFDAEVDDVNLDGEITTAMIGLDAEWERGVAGVVVSQSTGAGSYAGGDGGDVESEIAGVYPFGRMELGRGLSAWGLAGAGTGTIALTRDAGATMEADLSMRMAAFGVQGRVLAQEGARGVSVNAKSDAMWVGTSNERTGDLAAGSADVTRLRLVVEGSKIVAIGGGASLVPSAEVGLRHDAGDAEAGFGLDISGGLALSAPSRGLTAEVRGRGLLSHEAKGMRERGFSGALGWNQRPGSDRGAALTLIRTVGGSSFSGADALFDRATMEGLVGDDNGDDLDGGRLGLRLGYGFPAFGDRFTFVPEAGVELSDTRRDYSLGWRLVRRPIPGDPGGLEISFGASRRESADDDAATAHRIELKLNVRF